VNPNPDRVERGELLLSHLLRVGVLASAAVVALGLVLLFTQGPGLGYFGEGLHGLIVYPARTGGAPIDRSVADVVKGLRVGEPDAVISLGLLLLIATPIARVAASVLLFLAQRDMRYVLITLFVLTVLLVALKGGIAGA
jgi:uncharacterized membrane protein